MAKSILKVYFILLAMVFILVLITNWCMNDDFNIKMIVGVTLLSTCAGGTYGAPLFLTLACIDYESHLNNN